MNKERLKNIALAALSVSTVLLLYATWFYEVDDRSFLEPPVIDFFRNAFRIESFTDGSAEVTADAAVYPVKEAVGAKDGIYGVQYSTTSTMALYDKVRPIMAEALGSADESEKCSEENYKAALSQSVMAFWEFESKVPIYTLGAWLGAQTPSGLTRTVTSIALSSDGKQVSLYYREADTGMLYCAPTAVQDKMLSQAIEGYEANGCRFAFRMGEGYSRILPETVIFDAPPAQKTVKASAFGALSSKETLNAVLESFGYNPYTAGKYDDTDGSQVYVEDLSTLRIGAAGEIRYSASGSRGGVPIANLQENDSARDHITKMIESARDMISKTVANTMGDADFYFRAVEINSENEYTLLYDYCVGGVPVSRSDGNAAFRIEVQSERVSAAVFHLRTYTFQTTDAKMISEKYAAAALPENVKTEAGGARIFMRYVDNQSGEISPDWYYR